MKQIPEITCKKYPRFYVDKNEIYNQLLLLNRKSTLHYTWKSLGKQNRWYEEQIGTLQKKRK